MHGGLFNTRLSLYPVKGRFKFNLISKNCCLFYELIERRTKTNNMSVQKRVMKDVVDCENTILAVCDGRFPK